MGRGINAAFAATLGLFSAIAGAETAAVLVKATDKQFVCNAVVYKTQDVIVPLHCLPNLNPKEILIQSLPSRTFENVASIRSLVEREGYFPSYDLALLHLAKPLSGFKDAEVQTRPFPKTGRYVLETWRPPQFQKVTIPLRYQEHVEGGRIHELVSMRAEGSDLPCYGDSGSAVYWEQGKTRKLVGFLTGLFYPLTPSSYQCKDPLRLITALDPYQGWLKGRDQPLAPKASEPSTFKDLEDACQKQGPGHTAWVTLQNLFLSLLPAEKTLPDRRPLQEALVTCHGWNTRWSAFLASGQTLRFDTAPDIAAFPFLAAVKKAEFKAVNANELVLIAGWKEVEEVTLNGVDDGTDLMPLKSLKNLHKLSVLHGRGIKGLRGLLKELPQLQSLTLFNVKLENPADQKLIQQDFPGLHISWK